MSRFADADAPEEDPLDSEEEREEEEEDFGALEDEENVESRVASLFEPSRLFESVEEALAHDAALGWKTEAFRALPGAYDRIRVVNFIRSRVAAGRGPWTGEQRTPDELLQEVRENAGLPPKELWDSEDFLRPVLFDDLYLTWCDDEHLQDEEEYDGNVLADVQDEEIVREMTHLRGELLEHKVDIQELL